MSKGTKRKQLVSRFVEESIDTLVAVHNEPPMNIRTNGAIKHDTDKLRFDLIPASTEQALAEVLTHGCKKYSDENWRAGFQFKRVYSAARRHLNQWIDPRQSDIDEESGLSHLKHALCNLAFLIEFTESHPELDNRYKS